MRVFSTTTRHGDEEDTTLYLSYPAAVEGVAREFLTEEDGEYGERFNRVMEMMNRDPEAAADLLDTLIADDKDGEIMEYFIREHDHPWVFGPEGERERQMLSDALGGLSPDTTEADQMRDNLLRLLLGTGGKQPEPWHPELSSRELATVLHGLRIIQEIRAGNRSGCAHAESLDGDKIGPENETACDHFDEFVSPLTSGEIDALCERLNSITQPHDLIGDLWDFIENHEGDPDSTSKFFALRERVRNLLWDRKPSAVPLAENDSD